MEFDTASTATAFIGLFVVLIGGTVTSPMRTGTVAMVSGGLVVFGAVPLLLGVKHSEYRTKYS